MSERAYDISDLIWSWIRREQRAQMHPDLARDAQARYDALAKAFGADLDHPPAQLTQPLPGWATEALAVEARHRAEIFGAETASPTASAVAPDLSSHVFVELLRKSRSQILAQEGMLDGWLETPALVSALSARHLSQISSAQRAQESAWVEAMSDLIALIWGVSPETRVSSAELRASGYDDSKPAPDPLDYF